MSDPADIGTPDDAPDTVPDDIDAALREFDADPGASGAERSLADAAEPPPPPTIEDAERWRREAAEMGLDPERIERLLPAELKGVEQVHAARRAFLSDYQKARETLGEFAERLHREREAQDFRNFTTRLKSDLPELAALGDDVVQAMLFGLYQADDRVRAAWDQRYENPLGWQRRAARLTERLRDALSRRPDPDATATREAVAHAVRGAGNKPVERPAPAFERMTDAELNAFTRQFGFDAVRV